MGPEFDERARIRPQCLLLLAALPLAFWACGGGSPHLRADLPPMELASIPIDHNPFTRDRTGGISEGELIAAIESPVYLIDNARLGIVPVAMAYEADGEIPLVAVPSVLATAVEDTGFFTVASEVSTDWPSDRSISGLRELAARYRTRYLLLYRHRFIERDYANGWAATYLALVTIPFMPGKTLETAGVLEATLFDVRTGAIMFTVYERVHDISYENVFGNERKLREMREALLNEGAQGLAERVVDQMHRLVAARPTTRDTAVGSADQAGDPLHVATE